MILALLLSFIFFALGILHYYWALGGKWALEGSIPIKENEEKTMSPSKFSTAIVGLGLCLFGLYYLIKSGVLTYTLPSWIVLYTAWIIPSIFLLRAIGDFKYVGLFKKIKQSVFAKLDARVYTPLCLVIAIIGFIIVL